MKKILTIVLDGFGIKEDVYGNAVKNAGMNNFINIWNNYPHSLLTSYGVSLGLPKEQCGSSLVSNATINAGRKIKNRLSMFNEVINTNLLQANLKFREMINYLKSSGKNLHVMFLLSDAGVSSSISHLDYLINEIKNNKLSNMVYLHLVSDGVDTPKRVIEQYIKELKTKLPKNVNIASICGRAYAMDYTGDYNKTELYYNLLTIGEAIEAVNINQIIDLCYQKKMTDEYLPPIKTGRFQNVMQEDVFLFWNFSYQNQRQLLNYLINYPNLRIYSIFSINEKIHKNYFYEDEEINNGFCEYLSNLGINQVHIFESCKAIDLKYAYNGFKENLEINCDTYIAKSPQVDSYVKKPEMNALSVSKTIIDCMEKDYDFILANFANADELGHTGSFEATVNALQAIDVCLGKIIEKAQDNFYKVIILGSHSNVETMIEDKQIIPYNTLSFVPFIIMDKMVNLNNGSIVDVAKTILTYMDIAIPKEMKDSENLIEIKNSR